MPMAKMLKLDLGMPIHKPLMMSWSIHLVYEVYAKDNKF